MATIGGHFILESSVKDDILLNQKIKELISKVEKNRKIQGHICINNDGLFDRSVVNGVYGFPGKGKIRVDDLKITSWRAISSLFNIGPEDLIFLYRTNGSTPGSQEFHGVFKVLTKNLDPLVFLHPSDKDYLPCRNGIQYLPFRFLFSCFTTIPFSIPNDLRNKTYKKNNNLQIIKALSEPDPKKDKLWGFRHPAVMNIGAARKSSIVAISNKQVKFLLRLLGKYNQERPLALGSPQGKKYDPGVLPLDCTLLNSDFLMKHFASSDSINYEAELYAYILHSLKNSKSVLHESIIEDFSKINADMSIPFEEISSNVILEVILTPHIQEELDILLCDGDENNFLIFEIKNDMITEEDIEQCEKYIQLVRQKFPNSTSIHANIIGLKNTKLQTNNPRIKIVNYELERLSDEKTKINFIKQKI